MPETPPQPDTAPSPLSTGEVDLKAVLRKHFYTGEPGDLDAIKSAAIELSTGVAALSAQTGEPDWKFNCLSALKLLHEALDVIEDIDSECLLPGQLKDRADAALAPRQNAEPPYASPPPQPDTAKTAS